ncbi:MAG: hypothetical protein MUC34_21450, partial [Anaerolineae bacterium]|nr:hypothetical protein [Anaerolineae bacterium]
MLLAGVAVAAVARPPARALAPVDSVSLDGVTLAGMRTEVEAGGVWLTPYWWVDRTPGEAWRVRWRMKDAGGATVAERAARPYHNAMAASDWPPNTLVDDAHYLPLPDGARAGEYSVTAQLLSGSGASAEVPVAKFSVPTDRPAAPQPARALAAQFGGKIALLGYDPPATRAEPPAGIDAVARAGDALSYTLHWGATAAADENLHGFLHLTDAAGETLATRDQLAGGGR